jgi:hypothetical protein
MCNEDQIALQGLPGDQHVISADRRSLGGEHGSDRARLPGILLVEIEGENCRASINAAFCAALRLLKAP